MSDDNQITGTASAELKAIVEPLGFRLVRSNVRRRSGLFGSGNDEYVFAKQG